MKKREERASAPASGSRRREARGPVTRTLMLVVSTAGGYIGWWLGEDVGLMTAFSLSSVGTLLGLWGGYRLAQWIEG